MNKKQIEDLITNPLYTAVIGYSSSGRNTTPRYFVCIKDKQKQSLQNYYIEKEEIKHFEEVIKTADATRASRKAEIKADRIKKLDAKIKQAEAEKKMDELEEVDDTIDDFEDIALEDE